MVSKGPLSAVLLAGVLMMGTRVPAEPTAPAVSSFAPIVELETIIRELVSASVPRVKDEAAYRSGQQQLARDANTLIVLAVALGLHDADAALKPQAGDLVEAAEELAAAGSLTEAQAAVAALDTALGAEAAPQSAHPTSWENSASQDELMKQVAFLQGKIKRGARGARLASTAEENARLATVLAVIARAVEFDTVGIEGEQPLSQWRKLCGQMRDASTAVHAALTAKDAAATAAALTQLEQSCTACHQVFRPDLP